MKYYLGIDGGGTKTKFTLCTASGTYINSYIGKTCHYLQCGFDGLAEIIRDGIVQITKEAGLEPSDIAFAFAGCPGYGDVASDEAEIRASIDSGMGEIPHAIGNDCENALAAGIGNRVGINIIAGTGSVGCGINEHGDYERCGGWHHALGGDEGSGYWIGLRLLKEFQRQSDGRDEKTLLYDTVRSALDLRSDGEIVTRVVKEWNLDRTKIASLAPLCLSICNEGDPFAKAILADAASELADLAISLYRRLKFSDIDIPVSGTGGIFKMGAAITEPFSIILKINGMNYVKPILEPDMGAVFLAIKKAGLKTGEDVIKEMITSSL